MMETSSPAGTLSWAGLSAVAERRGRLAGYVLAGACAAGWATSRGEVGRIRRALAEARHAASHDGLTGLPNRQAAKRELDRRLAAGQSPLMVLLDLDGFKAVNDTFGHACGDALLAAVARRLRQATADGGFAARLGGDEFVLLLPTADPAEVGTIRDRLVRQVDLDGVLITPRASFGVTSSRPDKHWNTLLTEADAALYQAKQAGPQIVVHISDGPTAVPPPPRPRRRA